MYLKPLRSLLVDQGRTEAMVQGRQHKRVAGAPQQDVLEDMILSRANGRHEVVRRARRRQGCGIPAVEVGRVGDQRGIRFELGHDAFLDGLEWLKEGRLNVEVEAASQVVIHIAKDVRAVRVCLKGGVQAVPDVTCQGLDSL